MLISSPARRRVSHAVAAVVTLGFLTSTAAVTVAALFARRLLTPEREHPCDATVLDVEQDGSGRAVAATFASSVESEAPGRYGLYWDGEAGHAQIGEVLSRTDTVVVRAVNAVTRGTLRSGPARWSGYDVDGSPQEAYGIDTENVILDTEFGPAPAWVTRRGDGARWAVLVHGRAARRTETLRALPVLHDMGISVIVPTYRNDADGPASGDGRYALGLTEWKDVDVAVRYALDQGARHVDLLGWSMGGAIIMQFLARSSWIDAVGTVFLDGPVLDWGDVMAHHARLNKLPPGTARLAAGLLAGAVGHRFIGTSQPLDLARANWVARADELSVPVVIVHSVDDEFVPYGPTAALAQRRADLVTWHRWDRARHVREWNVDPKRWENVLRDALTA